MSCTARIDGTPGQTQDGRVAVQYTEGHAPLPVGCSMHYGAR
jgi:hypothetical protein